MAHPNTVRGPIEREHRTLIDARKKTFTEAQTTLEETFHADLATLEAARVADLEAAGFGPGGEVDPLTFDQVAPTNQVAPAVTGTPTTGQTLTCSSGTWLKADSYTYQWMRNGVAIGGATANTRVLVMADEGTSLKCRVTAHNETETATADSNTVSPTA